MKNAVFVNPVKRLIKITKPLLEIVHQFYGRCNGLLRLAFGRNAALHECGKAFGGYVKFFLFGLRQRFICERCMNGRLGSLYRRSHGILPTHNGINNEAATLPISKGHGAVGGGLFAAAGFHVVGKIPFVHPAVGIAYNSVTIQHAILPFSVIGLVSRGIIKGSLSVALSVDPFALVSVSARIVALSVPVLSIVVPLALIAFSVVADELAEAVSLTFIKFTLETPLPRHLFFAVSVPLAHVPVAVVGVFVRRTGPFSLAVAVAVLHGAAVKIAVAIPFFLEVSVGGISDRLRFGVLLLLLLRYSPYHFRSVFISVCSSGIAFPAK